MHLEFDRVHLHGFMSFGDAVISLSESGYTLVSGTNTRVEDLSLSNGSGKSSIFEAVSWCLTGSTIRGSKDVVNRYTDDGCFVELWFKCDGKEYYLLRSKDSSKYKTNLKLVVNGEDISGKGIRDSEKILSERLPDLTPSLIGSVIILGQGLPSRFTDNTPSGRKEVLEKLSKSDFMIEDLKNRIQSRKQELTDKLRVVEDTLLKASSEKSVHEARVVELTNKINSLNDRQSLVDRANLLDNEVGSITTTLNSKSSFIDAKNSELQSYRESYSQISVDASNEIASIDLSYTDILRISHDKMMQQQYSAEHISNEIRRMDSIRDVCPTCNQKLPGVIKPDTSSLKEELKMATQLCEQYKGEYSRSQQECECRKSKVSASASEKKDAITKVATALKVEIANLEAERQSIELTLNERKQELADVKFRLSVLSETYNGAVAELSVVQNKISECDNVILYNTTVAEDLRSHIDVVNKFGTLVSRDFRGYLLTNVIRYIDKKSKEYSLCVFGTDKVAFELDGNNISIGYDGKPYESLSGGERRKVDIIVQLAIRDMLCNYLSFSSNMLVIDEIFDNLDSVGCQNVLNLVSSKLNDVGGIFVITHHSDSLSIPYDREIVVRKTLNGVSEIV